MDTFVRDPAILSTCVEHWQHFCLQEGGGGLFQPQHRTRFSTAHLFSQIEYGKQQASLTLPRKSENNMQVRLHMKQKYQNAKVNATTFELVRLRPYRNVQRLTSIPPEFPQDLCETLSIFDIGCNEIGTAGNRTGIVHDHVCTRNPGIRAASCQQQRQ